MDRARRRFLAAAGAAALAAAAPGGARALETAEAERFVVEVVAEVTAMLRSGRPVEEQAARFSELFAARAAVPQIARFVMALAWRDMTDDQKARFEAAFIDYVGRTYARLLQDYKDSEIVITGAKDFGRKGVLVTSTAKTENGKPTAVEWLVNDRAGKGPQLVDIIIEGVSLLQSQRQEFAAMLENRSRNVDWLINDLTKG